MRGVESDGSDAAVQLRDRAARGDMRQHRGDDVAFELVQVGLSTEERRGEEVNMRAQDYA